MRRPIPTLIALAVTLVGCTDIISPPRAEPYEYRLPIVQGGESYQIAFHWPRSALPVRLWVANDDPLRPAVARALGIWNDTFLYGEFQGILVDDVAGADIVIRNQVAPAKLSAASRRLEVLAEECRGSTDFTADPVAGTLTLPFAVYVWPRTGPTDPGLATCYELTVLHEIGHALGLFVHSVEPTDLMYANPTRNGLSERDRATIEALYHLPATVTPVR